MLLHSNRLKKYVKFLIPNANRKKSIENDKGTESFSFLSWQTKKFLIPNAMKLCNSFGEYFYFEKIISYSKDNFYVFQE